MPPWGVEVRSCMNHKVVWSACWKGVDTRTFCFVTKELYSGVEVDAFLWTTVSFSSSSFRLPFRIDVGTMGALQQNSTYMHKLKVHC